MRPQARRILIIKLAALGDFIQAIGPMQAIRRAYPDADLTLLTTAPFRALAELSGLFDRIEIDDRPALWDVPGILTLRRRLKRLAPDLVFDLQTSDRSSVYFHLMAPNRPLWSGIARGCSHPHTNADRDALHTVARQRQQLAAAGIAEVAPTDLSFLPDLDPAAFGLPDRFALLAPGGAPHRPEKRWPAENFGRLAALLAARGLTPVVLGTKAEEEAAAAILQICPSAVSLLGKTSLLEMAPLARRAALAVGNDTGPMHLIATANCPSVVLFSGASDPALCGPQGADVRILRRPNLMDLPLEAVSETVETLSFP